MSRAGRSFFWFGFWVPACGLSLALAPGLMLRIAEITVSNDIMLRVFGTVLVYLAVYSFVAGRGRGYTALYRASVYTRFSATIVIGLFVVALKASPLVFCFTVVDALGALWTAVALKRDRAEAGAGQSSSSAAARG